MGKMSKRQAEIVRRRRIRELESKRDRAIEAKDKADANLRTARQALANARKSG